MADPVHQRQLIRHAVVAALKAAATSAGDRVFAARMVPFRRLELPAIAVYGLMIRLLGFSYAVPRPQPSKRGAIDLALGLMRALTPLARAWMIPASPSTSPIRENRW